MARNWITDTIYCGYVTFANKNNPEKTISYEYGPYENARTAKSQVTREINYMTGWNVVKSGVRKGTVTWTEDGIAMDKKERAAQLRAEKKAARENLIQSKVDEFYAELGIKPPVDNP